MNQKNIQGTSQGANKNEGLVDQAKHAVENVVGNVSGQARDQVTSQVTAQKDKAVGTISGVADALRQTSNNMKDSGPLPAIADQAADTVERVASYLKTKNLGDLVGEVERFARREPAIFLGSAFALGLLGGRFLKSSAPKRELSGGSDRLAYDDHQSGYHFDEPARFAQRRTAPELPPLAPRTSPSSSATGSSYGFTSASTGTSGPSTSGAGALSSSVGTTTKPMGSVAPPPVPGSTANTYGTSGTSGFSGASGSTSGSTGSTSGTSGSGTSGTGNATRTTPGTSGTSGTSGRS